MSKRYSYSAILVVSCFLAASAIYVLSKGANAFSECGGGQISSGTIGGPFELINQDGLTVTDKEVIIRPSLLYFGYTYCPDICPYDVARNVEASDLLKKGGYDATPVFISIDPKRDTPDVLRDFIANMDPKLMGLTGSDAQIKAASQAYKTYYKVNETGDDYYLVDHSTFSYLVLPDLGFVAFFRRDDTAEQIAEKTACFIKATTKD